MEPSDSPPCFRLQFASEDYPDRIGEITRGVYTELRNEPSVEIDEVTRPAGADERSGEVALLGQLSLTFLTSGAFESVLSTVRGFFERDRSLHFKLTRPDGQAIELECADFDDEQLGATLEQLKGFVQ